MSLSTPVRRIITAGIAAGCLIGAAAAATGPADAASRSTSSSTAKLPLSAAQLRADQRLHNTSGTAGGGSVTGLAQSPAGTPLAGICVTAYGPSGQKSAVTKQAGQFLISGLRPGKYQLQYRGCDPAKPYLPEWYGDTMDRGQSTSVVVSGLPLQAVHPVTLYPAGASLGQLSGTAADPQDGPNQMAADPFGSRTAGPASPAAFAHSLGLTRNAPGRIAAVSASHAGRISGKVTSTAGRPLAGICVEVVPTGNGDSFGFTSTGKTGLYKVGGLQAGDYQLIFFAQCGNTGNWLPQVYKGKYTFDNPTTVRVKASKLTSGINAVMKLGGEISGTVAGPQGKRLYGICVSPLQVDNPFDFNSLPVFSATSVKGVYHVRGVPAGSYQLGFAPCGSADYAPTLWPGTQNYNAAATIRVRPAEVISNIDEVMQLGGIIKGTVTSAADPATGLGGMCVTVQEQNGLGDGGIAITGANGGYVIKGLDAGAYSVDVQTGCGNNGNYVDANYPSNVTVGYGATRSGIDVALPTGAIISGTVTSAQTSLPVAGICVEVFSTDGFVDAQVTTAADGTYSVNQLTSDTYQVVFSGGCGNSGSYAPQGYDNTNVLFPQNIAITTGQDATGIDAVLQPGPSISGTVKSSTGRKLSGICVVAVSPGGVEYGIAASLAGRYDLTNLAPGPYQVGFGPGCGNNSDLAAQWFRSQASEDNAALVSTDTGTVGGIDAALSPAGGISGSLKSKSGRALEGGCVDLTGVSGAARSISEQVPAFGNPYQITGMPLGKYQVAFQPSCFGSGYATQWYKDKPTPAHATDVTVRAGHIQAHIDSAVVLGGTIVGQVTSNGKPVHDVCVYAQNISQQDEYGFGTSNVHGDYKIRGLNSGRYELDLSPCGKAAQALASEIAPSLVKVTAPHATTANLAVPDGGSLTGTVNGESPSAAQVGVCVLALQVGGDNIGLAMTAPDGTFTVSNLPAGQYQVDVGEASCGLGAPNLAPQWYPAAQTEATAGTVTVTAGGSTALTAMTLNTDGSIAGTVTGPGSAPLAGVCVAATPPGPGQIPLYAVTSSDGSYTLYDVIPGQYIVEFSSGCGATGYLTQWWKGAAASGAATPVNVTAGNLTADINAALLK